MRENKYPRRVKKMQSIYSKQVRQHVDKTVSLLMRTSLRCLLNYEIVFKTKNRERKTRTWHSCKFQCTHELHPEAFCLRCIDSNFVVILSRLRLHPLLRKCELGLAMAILPGDKPFSARLLQIYVHSELLPSDSPAKRSGKKQVLNS